MEDMVSIIMPVYNVTDYVGESIKSIQDQTYVNWELLVVNDGSTDDTAEVVAALADKDHRIKLINQANGGVSRARNTGLDLAKGSLISFLDGDDLWEPTFLADLIEAKNRTGAGMAYCAYDHLHRNRLRRKYRYQTPSGRILLAAIKGTVRIVICGLVVDRSIVSANNLSFTPDCPYAEDWEFIAKVLTLTDAARVSESLLIYRVRRGSAIHSQWDWRKRIHGIWVNERLADFIQEHLPKGPQRREILQALRQRTAYDAYRFFWRMVKNGYHEDAMRLLQDPRYRRYFDDVDPATLKSSERWKYRLVSSQNPLAWSLARLVP